MDDTRVKNAQEIKKSLSANKERMNSLKQLSRKKAQSLDDDLYEDEENQASEEDDWEDAVKEPSKVSKRAERYEKHSKQGISKKTQNRISAMEKSHKSEELSDESDCPGKYSQADDVELSLVAAGGKKKTEPRTAPNNGRHKGRKLIKWGGKSISIGISPASFTQ
jgi:HD superfamily phosphohydrolase